LPNTDIVTVLDDDPAAAAQAAGEADVAIVVVGYTAEDEGEYTDPTVTGGPEVQAMFPTNPAGSDDFTVSAAGSESLGMGGDRASLRLREVDEEIIAAVGQANPRTIVAIVAAGAVVVENWREKVPAIVMAWYSGMEGGHGLADVLLGQVDPSGRLPFSIPTDESHLPFFDREATAITYDRFHGQRLLDKLGVDAAFPLGFGLSYTTFELGAAAVTRDDAEQATVTVPVTNTGQRAGRHVVQVYGVAGTDLDAAIVAGERHLVGFAPVALEAGQTINLQVPVSLRPLSVWDADAKHAIAPDDVTLIVGSYVTDPASQQIAC
jgi:beta-glucosidase